MGFVCRGNPEGVAAALPTSPDRGTAGSHARAEPRPEPQHVGGESDVVMQEVKQETKPLPSAKPQVRCCTLYPTLRPYSLNQLLSSFTTQVRLTVAGPLFSACIVGILGFDSKACNQPGVMGPFIFLLHPLTLITDLEWAYASLCYAKHAQQHQLSMHRYAANYKAGSLHHCPVHAMQLLVAFRVSAAHLMLVNIMAHALLTSRSRSEYSNVYAQDLDSQMQCLIDLL